MLSEKLKIQTLTNHQQLEKMLVSRMKSIRSTTDYVNLLQLFYSYFGGLENRIDEFMNEAEMPDYGQRRKVAALEQDIADMGGRPAEKATGNDLPVIQNVMQAYGAMYVMEGSALGGKIISKMMAQQLDFTNGKGLLFFNGYGNDTQAMWDSFKQTLDTKVQTPEQQDLVVYTANQTFAKFKAWAERQAA